MKFRNLLCVAAIAIAGPMFAHAWTAVAADANYDMSGANHSQLTPEAATALALKDCGYGNKPGCRLIGPPQQEKIIVTFAGEASIGFGADQNGEKAALAARKDCERLSRRCEPVLVRFAPGFVYAAIAVGSEKGYYVYPGAASQKDANRAVLALCAADYREQECKLQNLPAMNDNTFYASAVSDASRFQFINRNIDKDKAVKFAMTDCEAAGNKDCILAFRDVYNGSSYMTVAQRTWISDFMPFVEAGQKRIDRQRRGS